MVESNSKIPQINAADRRSASGLNKKVEIVLFPTRKVQFTVGDIRYFIYLTRIQIQIKQKKKEIPPFDSDFTW